MAETDIGKALQGMVDAGEKLVMAAKGMVNAAKVAQQIINPPPPDDTSPKEPKEDS